MSEFIEPPEFLEFFKKKRVLIDVRSEIEFADGHLPGAINLPILNTAERVLVGTAYKQQGPAAAIELGHKLVCGRVKEHRVKAWLQALLENDHSVLTCFRGGLRSQLAQAWCKEAGLSVPRIFGGTKALRNFLIEQTKINLEKSDLLVISGATGAGKSLLLRDLMAVGASCLDLEKLAHHRGSAFGGYAEPQPSQVLFENKISCELIRLNNPKTVLIEDESRMIGHCVQPEILFQKLKESNAVCVDEDLESRTRLTFEDYILNSDIAHGSRAQAQALFSKYKQSVQRISKKLGGLRAAEVLKDLADSEKLYDQNKDLDSNKVWISKLLDWYYDPLYFKNIEQRKINFIFRGSRKQVFDYLKNLKESREQL